MSTKQKTRLTAGDAVAAIIELDDSRFLLQLRDSKPGIYYPSHWGLFGGAVDEGESPEQALCRELEEELDFRPEKYFRFTNFDFDFSFCGYGVLYRTYYVVRITAKRLNSLVLGEGSAFRAFAPEKLFSGIPVVPYDSFALWLYLHQDEIGTGRRTAEG